MTDENRTTTYTPAPWSLWHNGKGAFQVTEGAGRRPEAQAVICSRNDFDHRSEESIANAHLIVAAPDMLEALRGALVAIECTPSPEGAGKKFCDAITERRNAVVAAIAKAEGRHNALTEG